MRRQVVLFALGVFCFYFVGFFLFYSLLMLIVKQ